MLTWASWKLLESSKFGLAFKLASWGADLKSQRQGKLSLNEAIAFSHPSDMADNIRQGLRYVDVNSFDHNGVTPLMTVARYGDVFPGYNTALRLLLTAGADPNRQDNHGWTAMMYAASSFGVNSMRLLYSTGADVSVKVHQGETALSIACSKGSLTCVRALVEWGAEINQHCQSGLTPLACASASGSIETVQYLIDSGAGINLAAFDKKGESDTLVRLFGCHLTGVTPLMAATRHGHSEVVQYLLDRGADVNAKGWTGETALFIAVEYGWQEICRMLLDSNACINCRLNVHENGEGGETLLHVAVASGPVYSGRRLGLEGCLNLKEQICAMLLQAGADPNAKDAEGKLPAEIIDGWPKDRVGRLPAMLASDSVEI